MDRGAWQATYSPWDRKESDKTEAAEHRVHTHTLLLEKVFRNKLLLPS